MWFLVLLSQVYTEYPTYKSIKVQVVGSVIVRHTSLQISLLP